MSTGETFRVANPTESFSSIDSALQSGLRDPRERVALLRLEQALVDFMTGDPCIGWMEVGGPANSLVLLPNKNPLPASSAGGPIYQSSFHRLLVHRLADRFGIIREKGLILDNSLRLIKVPESKVPETLLRDLDPADFSGGAAASAATTPSSSTPMNRVAPILARSDSSGTGGNSKPRKLKIMKRQSSQPMKSSSGSTGSGRRESRRVSSASDLESREKAYAEARARIFSDGSVEEAKSTSSQNGETDDSLGASGHGLAQAVASRLSLSESSTTSTNPATPQKSQTSADGSTPDQTRAVYRNRAEEAADPDFQRGAAAVVYQQNNMYYGTTPSSNHYGYASAASGTNPNMRAANNLAATAPAFYPGGAPAAPYIAYPVGAWQPQSQPLQRPSGQGDRDL